MIAFLCVAVSEPDVIGKLMKYLLQNTQHVVIDYTFLLSKIAAVHLLRAANGDMHSHSNLERDINWPGVKNKQLTGMPC